MKEIHLLPPNLISQPSARLVENWYRMSFEELVGFAEMNSHDEDVRKTYVYINLLYYFIISSNYIQQIYEYNPQS